jgi:hypothetical protein
MKKINNYPEEALTALPFPLQCLVLAMPLLLKPMMSCSNALWAS